MLNCGAQPLVLHIPSTQVVVLPTTSLPRAESLPDGIRDLSEHSTCRVLAASFPLQLKGYHTLVVLIRHINYTIVLLLC